MSQTEARANLDRYETWAASHWNDFPFMRLAIRIVRHNYIMMLQAIQLREFDRA